jgi:hypothetical protein
MRIWQLETYDEAYNDTDFPARIAITGEALSRLKNKFELDVAPHFAFVDNDACYISYGFSANYYQVKPIADRSVVWARCRLIDLMIEFVLKTRDKEIRAFQNEHCDTRECTRNEFQEYCNHCNDIWFSYVKSIDVLKARRTKVLEESEDV